MRLHHLIAVLFAGALLFSAVGDHPVREDKVTIAFQDAIRLEEGPRFVQTELEGTPVIEPVVDRQPAESALLPPGVMLWLAWPLYVLIGLVVLVLAVLVDRIQRKRVIHAERVRALVRESELKAQAFKAENERNRVELEKARELEKMYRELEKAHQHLKDTQDQLIRQEKLASLGQLTAGVAHEIRNPLNFINNFAELNAEIADELLASLRDGEPVSPDHVRDMVEILRINDVKIGEQGKRVDAIIRTMLQHSRALPDRRHPTHVNDLVDEYVTLAYHGARGHLEDFSVQIERDYDERVGDVDLARQEMGTVLINLLNNAFYAVHEKKKDLGDAFTPVVIVRTRCLVDRVEIRITDNGTGIPQNAREHIFEPFFTTKPAGHGTGLGLSLVYQIVTLDHHGDVSVESEEGVGSTFIVVLPVRMGSNGLRAQVEYEQQVA